MIAGVFFAILHVSLKWDTTFFIHYIKPIGGFFINSLKALSIPLVITGIIQGISSMDNAKKLSKIGLKVVSLYIITTILAICLGLVISGLVQPGKKFSSSIRENFIEQCETSQKTFKKVDKIASKQEIIPDNLFKAFSDNSNLLFIILFAILFAIGLLNIDARKRKIVIDFYEAINEVFREIIKLIMRFAPLGIFSLTCSILIEQTKGKDLSSIYEFLIGVVWYTGTVIAGLSLMTFAVYPFLVLLLSKTGWSKFLKAIYPAQLIAFTTSSSAAALPITIECAEKNLSISKTISNFVLSLGATINMDGTVLYQAIAISFIAQAYGVDLTVEKILTIVGYLTISSFGLGGLPGVSLGVTSILIGMLEIPAEALALIIMPDRLLDMARSATNITGDLFVALTVDRLEKNKR